MPASVSASSYTSDWALIRYSTAISAAGVPDSMSFLIVWRRAAASATSSGCSAKDGFGPGVTLTDEVQLAARHPAARRGDDPVGQRHHLRGGAVVALQPHHGGLREAPGEVQQELRGGAGERVDGLVGIADDREVVTLAEPGVEHPLLQRGDVLVLVDDEAAVAVPELLGDRRVVLDRRRGVQQQVVEIEQRGPSRWVLSRS